MSMSEGVLRKSLWISLVYGYIILYELIYCCWFLLLYITVNNFILCQITASLIRVKTEVDVLTNISWLDTNVFAVQDFKAKIVKQVTRIMINLLIT